METKKLKKQIGLFAMARLFETSSKLAISMILAGALYKVTDSPLWVSLVLFVLYGLPFLFSPVAGFLADKIARKKVMLFSLLSTAFCYGLMAFSQSPFWLLFCTAGASVLGCAFAPANNSLVPKLVPSEKLPWANGRMAIGRNMGFLVGPTIGGLLVALQSHSVAFLGTAVFAFLAALFVFLGFQFYSKNTPLLISSSATPMPTQGIFGFKKEPSPRIEDLNAESQGAKLEKDGIFAGLAWLKTQPFLMQIMLSLLLIYAGLGLSLPGEVVLADFFNAGSLGYAGIVACWGIGNILGNFQATKREQGSELKTMQKGFLLFALGFWIVAISPWMGLVFLAIILGGYGEGQAVVSGQLLVQKNTPEQVLGRTFAVQEAITTMGFALPVLLSGFLIDVYGVKALYLVSGTICFLGAMILFLKQRNKVSHLKKTFFLQILDKSHG